MTNKIYTIYNNLSKRYGNVFPAASDGMAEKNTRLFLKSQNEDLSELELIRIGAIDVETGKVTVEEGRVVIAWNESNVLPVAPTEEELIN